MTARRSSYLVAVTANTLLMVLNLGATLLAWRRGDSSGSIDFSATVTCLGALTLWFLIAMEGLITTKQATIDSALEEQRADTRMKQLLAEKFATGQVEISASAIRERAH